MSTKRRKVSHEPGALKDVSIKAPKTKSKSQPVPKPKEPSPAPSSDVESETIDDATKADNEDDAPKSFADLVWARSIYCSQAVRTNGFARELSIHSARPASGWATRSRHPFKSSQFPSPCKDAT